VSNKALKEHSGGSKHTFKKAQAAPESDFPALEDCMAFAVVHGSLSRFI